MAPPAPEPAWGGIVATGATSRRPPGPLAEADSPEWPGLAMAGLPTLSGPGFCAEGTSVSADMSSCPGGISAPALPGAKIGSPDAVRSSEASSRRRACSIMVSADCAGLLVASDMSGCVTGVCCERPCWSARGASRRCPLCELEPAWSPACVWVRLSGRGAADTGCLAIRDSRGATEESWSSIDSFAGTSHAANVLDRSGERLLASGPAGGGAATDTGTVTVDSDGGCRVAQQGSGHGGPRAGHANAAARRCRIRHVRPGNICRQADCALLIGPAMALAHDAERRRGAGMRERAVATTDRQVLAHNLLECWHTTCSGGGTQPAVVWAKCGTTEKATRHQQPAKAAL